MQIKTVVLDDSPLQLIANCKVVVQNPYLKLVASFTDAGLALRYLEENPFDLLLTDVEMPAMNGFLVMAMVPSHIDVIMNSTDTGFALEAELLGASAFFT